MRFFKTVELNTDFLEFSAKQFSLFFHFISHSNLACDVIELCRIDIEILDWVEEFGRIFHICHV